MEDGDQGQQPPAELEPGTMEPAAVNLLEMMQAATLESDAEAEEERLYKQFMELYGQGLHADAIPLAERCRDLCLRRVGRLHEDSAALLTNLGQLYHSVGDVARAEETMKEVLEIEEQVHGRTHPEFASSLKNLVSLYQTMGNLPRAAEALREAIQIEEQVLGRTHPDFATSLNNLGSLYRQMGDMARAEEPMREALEIREKVLGKMHPDTNTSLDMLGALYLRMGEFARAEEALREAFKIREQVLGRLHPDTATSFNNLGTLYQELGDLAQAEAALREALEIREKVLGRTHPHCAASLNNLASLYQKMGSLARAEEAMREVIQIQEQTLGKTHPLFAASLNNLGSLYYDMGDLARAEERMRESLEINEKVLGKTHHHVAISLNNLASLYQEMCEGTKEASVRRDLLTKALDMQMRCLVIQEKALGRKHPQLAGGLNNLATVYRELGDFAKGHGLMVQVVEMAEEALGRKHPTFAWHLHNLSTFKVGLGDLQGGFPLLEEACSIHAELLSRTLSVLAPGQRLHLIQSVDFAIGAIVSQGLKLCEGTFPQEVQDSAKRRCFMEIALRKNLLFDCEAQDSELVHLARACDEELVAKELMDLDSNVKAARSQLARSLFEKPDPQAYARLEQELEGLERSAAQKVAQIRGTGSDEQTVDLHHMEPHAFVNELGRLLPENAALVEFFFNGKAKKKKAEADASYVAFVLCAGGSSIHLDFLELGNAKEIQRDVERFLDFAADSKFGFQEKKVKAGHKLQKQLLDKVLATVTEHLGQAPEHLFLCPDGELFRLPFVALPVDAAATDRARWRYVLDEAFSVSYLTAARDLFRLSAMPPPKALATCRLFFNPLFTAEPEVDADVKPLLMRDGALFEELPSTEEEGQAVMRLLQAQGLRVESFSGDRATRRELLATSAPSILHIATHGFAEPYEAPDEVGWQRVKELRAVPEPLLRCGLAMTGAQTWQKSQEKCGSGIVTGLELRNLDLKGTALVTLSACETGLGQVNKGQGMACLGRVVLLAGAETVLVTACEVVDQSTKDLMEAFYTELLKESSSPFHRARALRAAQRAVRQRSYPSSTGLEKADHPLWWAPLTLYGATGPLPLCRGEGPGADADH